MTQGFEVSFTPVPTAARVSRHRVKLSRYVLFLILSAISLSLLWWFDLLDLTKTAFVITLCLWIGSPLLMVIVYAVSLWRAKNDLAHIQSGTCFLLGAQGIQLLSPNPASLSWEEIDFIRAKGSRIGAGPRLAVSAGGKEWVAAPFSFLDADPALIDSMIRACSLGKHHLDGRSLEATI